VPVVSGFIHKRFAVMASWIKAASEEMRSLSQAEVRPVRGSISFAPHSLGLTRSRAIGIELARAMLRNKYAVRKKESEVKEHETSYFGSASFFDVSSRGSIRLRGARPLLRRSPLALLEIIFLAIDALKRAALSTLKAFAAL